METIARDKVTNHQTSYVSINLQVQENKFTTQYFLLDPSGCELDITDEIDDLIRKNWDFDLHGFKCQVSK